MVSSEILDRLNRARQPRAKRVPTPIAKRSPQMKATMKEYKPLVKEYLKRPENQECKIKMKGCTGVATCIHHVSGRLGSKLTDESDFVPACSSCNSVVESSDAEAREKGFKKSRMGKVNKK